MLLSRKSGCKGTKKKSKEKEKRGKFNPDTAFFSCKALFFAIFLYFCSV